MSLAPGFGGFMEASPGAKALAEVLGRAVENPEDLDQVGERGAPLPMLVAAEHRPGDVGARGDLLSEQAALLAEAPEGLAYLVGYSLVGPHGVSPGVAAIASGSRP